MSAEHSVREAYAIGTSLAIGPCEKTDPIAKALALVMKTKG